MDERRSLLSVIILTHNEEQNLPACLESLRGLECEVFVVDSGSTDRTVEIAREWGARVASHPFETHARQWAWALKNLPLSGEWVLGLDADQRLTPELAGEIRKLFREETVRLENADGFWMKRRQMFRGRWIRHGGYYPFYLLKLFRKSRVLLDEYDRVDHHFYVAGRTEYLEHDIIEENRKEDEILFWIQKHLRYAQLLAEEEWMRRNGRAPEPVAIEENPYRRRLRLKRIWYRLPLYFRSIGYFFYRYFVRLGFLDGKEGFIFHFLQAFWFRLLVDIRLEELTRRQQESGKVTE